MSGQQPRLAGLDTLLPKKAGGWLPIRIAVGCLLLATAILKAFSPSDSVLLESAYHLPHWVIVLVVQAEVALGMALLAGLRPNLVRWSTLGVFVVFAAFSAYRGFSGSESCGCFGPITVHPWWTFALDVFVLGLLASFGPVSTGSTSYPIAPLMSAVGYAALGGICLYLMAMRPGSAPASNPLLKNLGGLTLLEPESWAGEAFPLGPHINPPTHFNRGEWIVVLYHHDCPKCIQARPKYAKFAANAAPSRPSVLLVEVPPYGADNHSDKASTGLYAQLANDREWFVEAPVEIKLRDGIVILASKELPSIADDDQQP